MHQIGNYAVLGGKWALADPSCVGLHRADHPINPVRRYARPGASASGGRIRGGDIRVSPMIHVQKCSLRAFKKNLFPGRHRLVNRQDRVGDQWSNFFTNFQILIEKRLKSDWLLAEISQH